LFDVKLIFKQGKTTMVSTYQVSVGKTAIAAIQSPVEFGNHFQRMTALWR